MYYYEEIMSDIEELVMDFLMYRRSKRSGSIDVMQAHNKELFNSSDMLKLTGNSITAASVSDDDMLINEMFADELFPPPLMPLDELDMTEDMGNEGWPMENGHMENMPMQNGSMKNMPMENMPMENMPMENMPMENMPQQPEMSTEEELEYVKMILSEISRKLYPFVLDVLREYEYEGSPIYDEYLDKEALAQIVDKVIDKAKNEIAEVNDITNMEARPNKWTVYQMLRAIIEMLIVTFIKLRKRRIRKPMTY